MLDDYVIELFVTEKYCNNLTAKRFSVLLVTILCGDIEGETDFAELMITTMCDAVFVLQHFTVQK